MIEILNNNHHYYYYYNSNENIEDSTPRQLLPLVLFILVEKKAL